MKIVELRSRVGEDGVLRLEIPVEARSQELEVLIVMNPVSRPASPIAGSNAWPSGYFESTAGAFRNEPMERGDQGGYDYREPLE